MASQGLWSTAAFHPDTERRHQRRRLLLADEEEEEEEEEEHLLGEGGEPGASTSSSSSSSSTTTSSSLSMAHVSVPTPVVGPLGAALAPAALPPGPGGATGPADRKHFSLHAYTDYISEEEERKVERMLAFLTEESKQAAASTAPTSEEDLPDRTHSEPHPPPPAALISPLGRLSVTQHATLPTSPPPPTCQHTPTGGLIASGFGYTPLSVCVCVCVCVCVWGGGGSGGIISTGLPLGCRCLQQESLTRCSVLPDVFVPKNRTQTFC
ncbi:hypothetical protein CRUP_001698 [Coryphaenoides rupestris]|nr:hypothetical protein CRUP_001698 [Coryphaenoides rupestris]